MCCLFLRLRPWFFPTFACIFFFWLPSLPPFKKSPTTVFKEQFPPLTAHTWKCWGERSLLIPITQIAHSAHLDFSSLFPPFPPELLLQEEHQYVGFGEGMEVIRLSSWADDWTVVHWAKQRGQWAFIVARVCLMWSAVTAGVTCGQPGIAHSTEAQQLQGKTVPHVEPVHASTACRTGTELGVFPYRLGCSHLL